MSGNTADILRVQHQDELIFTTPALSLASGDGRECRETRLFLGPNIYEPSLKIQVVKCFLESGKKLRELSVTVVCSQIYFDWTKREFRRIVPCPQHSIPSQGQSVGYNFQSSGLAPGLWKVIWKEPMETLARMFMCFGSLIRLAYEYQLSGTRATRLA